MKNRYRLGALIIGALLTLSSCSLYSLYDLSPEEAVSKLERGMSMQTVRSLMGATKVRSILPNGQEVWEYQQTTRDGVIYSNRIHFDLSGRLTQVESHFIGVKPAPVVVQSNSSATVQQPTAGVIQHPRIPIVTPPTGTNDPFKQLLRDIEQAFFDDKQLELLDDYLRYNEISVVDATKVIKLFSGEDDQLEALRHIAPRLSDKAGRSQLVDLFFFPSNKKEAAKILGLTK